MISLVDFLKWCATPSGITLAAGAMLSWLAEYVSLFKSLKKKWKRLVMLAASLVVPLAALGLGALFFEWPVDPETVWAAIAAGGAAFTTSQLAHLRKLGNGNATNKG